jgi:hypothetical protein
MKIDTYNGMYNIQFSYNNELKISAATVYRDMDFVNAGTAKCSEDDRYCKEKGRKLALSRALEVVDREDRTAIWNHYATKLSKTPKWPVKQ